MNTISNSHKRFSERLRNFRVLENPKEFLGENFEAVLNFWLILDDLSEEQWRVIDERYWAFYNENFSEWRKAKDLAWDTSFEVVGADYVDEAEEATYDVTESSVADLATLELIGLHKILEDHQKTLTFFSMFLNLF